MLERNVDRCEFLFFAFQSDVFLACPETDSRHKGHRSLRWGSDLKATTPRPSKAQVSFPSFVQGLIQLTNNSVSMRCAVLRCSAIGLSVWLQRGYLLRPSTSCTPYIDTNLIVVHTNEVANCCGERFRYLDIDLYPSQPISILKVPWLKIGTYYRWATMCRGLPSSPRNLDDPLSKTINILGQYPITHCPSPGTRVRPTSSNEQPSVRINLARFPVPSCRKHVSSQRTNTRRLQDHSPLSLSALVTSHNLE